MASINVHAVGNVPPPAVTGGKGEPFWYEDVFWVVWRLGAGVLPAGGSCAVHLQDVDVVGEAVQQGSGELGSKDVGPLVEGEVGGEDGAPFVALATSKRSSAPVVDRGTKPSSSMISSLRRES